MEAKSPVKGLAYGAIASCLAEMGEMPHYYQCSPSIVALPHSDSCILIQLLGFFLAVAATMPIDVVKTRLQFSGADGSKAYSGAIDCVSKTIKGEGIGALFKVCNLPVMKFLRQLLVFIIPLMHIETAGFKVSAGT